MTDSNRSTDRMLSWLRRAVRNGEPFDATHREAATLLKEVDASIHTASPSNRWYLGSMNDGLFIIDMPPRPSTDDIWHDRPDGPGMVLNVTDLPHAKAQAIVDAHNASLSPEPSAERPHHVLFDGYAVFNHLSEQAKRRTSWENVSDVLDATVRAFYAMTSSAHEPGGDAALYKWRIEQVRELCTSGVALMPTKAFLAESVLHWLERYPPETKPEKLGGCMACGGTGLIDGQHPCDCTSVNGGASE